MSDTFHDCWFLTGATAVGKSAVGIALARRLGAEIISLDSMAIYRGMDIGTAKPSAADRETVLHHLIDIVDPGYEYNVYEFTPGFSGRAGLAFYIGHCTYVDLGMNVSMSFEGDFFAENQTWLEPYGGVLCRR